MSVNEIIDATLRHGHVATVEQISTVVSRLMHLEMKWRDRAEFLEKEGYILRSRLRPGWTPSWLDSEDHPMNCEDGQQLPPRPRLVDATDKSSGGMVYIKEIETDSEEHRIAEVLKQAGWNADPRNHCVQVLNILRDPLDPGMMYMVMPFLRPMDNPPFQHVSEIMDFADQILEGLVFLHEKGIAHRDCVPANIMMDGNAMYPNGFHPIKIHCTPDALDLAEHTSRSVSGAKYYFVDFGLSSYFPDTTSSKLVTGTDGRDQDPPELSDTDAYDPFKLDIFIIGNMLKRDFCEEFCNLGFFQPLIKKMTKEPPTDRPDAVEVLALWKQIRDTVWSYNREWRPRPRREHPIETVVLDSVCFRDLCTRVFNRVAEYLPVYTADRAQRQGDIEEGLISRLPRD